MKGHSEPSVEHPPGQILYKQDWLLTVLQTLSVDVVHSSVTKSFTRNNVVSKWKVFITYLAILSRFLGTHQFTDLATLLISHSSTLLGSNNLYM